jgi:hypothetical protein
MNNPTGKGGFADNPSNRNNKGRPPKGYSITEIFRETFSADPALKKALLQSIITQALSGDVSAQRLVWQYMDGMPPQSLDVTSKGEKITSVEVEVIDNNEAKTKDD